MKKQSLNEPQIFDNRDCNVGEGPIAIGSSNEKVWWVDVLGKRILSRDLDGTLPIEVPFDEDVSFLIPCVNGDFIVGTSNGPVRMNQEGQITKLPTRESLGGVSDSFPMRWNDAKVAPDGHLWLGTMPYQVDAHPNNCGLYRLDKVGKTLVKVVDGVGVSNGLAWSKDGRRMFFIDTPTLSIDAFDYLDGELSNRERLWTVPDESYGYPDGMCIDSQDGLWVAFWNGGKVRRFNAEFEITDEIELSQPLVTSCAFAGENLNTLIITTAHLNKSGRDENWGKTYRAQVLIPGRPTQLFPG